MPDIRSPESNAADDFCAFVDASPSPFHVCHSAAQRLRAGGYRELIETEHWPTADGKYFIRRGGSLLAWTTGTGNCADGFKIIGAHTDSPNLRLKQHHDVNAAGAAMLSLEPYGGVLLDTWLDRDLGVSGRLVTRNGAEHIVLVDEPIVRVPHIAIHLDRDNAGAAPDRQRHLNGLWSLRDEKFLTWLAARAGINDEDIAGFDLMTHAIEPAARTGAHGELIAAPRLDNQVTCYSALMALLNAHASSRSMVVLFDHEEIGSTSERGANSDFLLTTIERIILAAGGGREELLRCIAGSICVSGDMAHATHPNYPEKHEPWHHIQLGGGPVLKVNQNVRYATDAHGAATFAAACSTAGVPMQRYIHRADLPCGSTIGPLSAARTGILTIDVGAPQLAMHSARETMAASDIDSYIAALTAFIGSAAS